MCVLVRFGYTRGMHLLATKFALFLLAIAIPLMPARADLRIDITRGQVEPTPGGAELLNRIWIVHMQKMAHNGTKRYVIAKIFGTDGYYLRNS